MVLTVKNPLANAEDIRDTGFDPSVEKIRWGRIKTISAVDHSFGDHALKRVVPQTSLLMHLSTVCPEGGVICQSILGLLIPAV